MAGAVDDHETPGDVGDDEPAAVRRPDHRRAGIRVVPIDFHAGVVVDARGKVEHGKHQRLLLVERRGGAAVRGDAAGRRVGVRAWAEHAMRTGAAVNDICCAAVLLVALFGQPAGRADGEQRARRDSVYRPEPNVIDAAGEVAQQVAGTVRARHAADRDADLFVAPAVEIDEVHAPGVVRAAGWRSPELARLGPGQDRPVTRQRGRKCLSRLAIADNDAAALPGLDEHLAWAGDERHRPVAEHGGHRGADDAAGGQLDAQYRVGVADEELPRARPGEQLPANTRR